ncbi:MAG: hypothetical protein HYW25_00295 [Candidatus Aenigmarchaeota archaeon]|nr:hypothetical protein [Candidatus Aenigmarchaeota archaeon]
MAVVDSSCIIHLARIGKLRLLKEYFGRIKITKEIEREITMEEKTASSEIKSCIGDWIMVKDAKANGRTEYENLEKGDAQIIELARHDKDILITNDAAIILVARSLGIEVWWLTTFLLKCLKKGIIAKRDAKKILYELTQSGMRLSIEVYAAIEREMERM